MNWYYANGQEIHGPVSRAELEALFAAGVVTVESLVLQEGMYQWIHFVDLKKTTQILPVIGTTATPATAETTVAIEKADEAARGED
jgi:hypothetical protein